MFTRFIKWFVDGFASLAMAYLMNLMNVCVVRQFKRFFENMPFWRAELMKWK